jgi:hypothetical protein
MNAECLDWLLEPGNPSARYLTLRRLQDRPEDDPQVIEARQAIPRSPPARDLLDAQYPAGYWLRPGRGYSPRFKATMWQIVFLADLGAPQIEVTTRACEHVLAHALRPDYGLFSAHQHSSGIYPCLNGDLLRALWHFGFGDHPVVCTVADALARRVASRGFTCVRNGGHFKDPSSWQPCVWGCVKALRGLAAIPDPRRSPAIEPAIACGVAYLLAHDLTQDQHPAWAETPSPWLRLGFPSGDGSDLLEALLALAELGAPLPGDAVHLLRQKQLPCGRWPLERALRSTWADFGTVGRPNKWVTLRAREILAHHALSLTGEPAPRCHPRPSPGQ